MPNLFLFFFSFLFSFQRDHSRATRCSCRKAACSITFTIRRNAGNRTGTCLVEHESQLLIYRWCWPPRNTILRDVDPSSRRWRVPRGSIEFARGPLKSCKPEQVGWPERSFREWVAFAPQRVWLYIVLNLGNSSPPWLLRGGRGLKLGSCRCNLEGTELSFTRNICRVSRDTFMYASRWI